MPAKTNAETPTPGSLAPSSLSRLALFTMSEKGGVWKTALVARLVPYMEAAGLRVAIVQVDQQPQLDALFPGRVTTVVMPDAATLREDDTADAHALSPLYDVLLDPRWDAVAVDVGANLDQRVLAFMANIDLHEVLVAENMTLIGLVPMRPDDEAVLLGCRTMARLRVSLPSIRIVPVLCADNRREFHTLRPDAQALFDTDVGPCLASGDGLLFRRLPPRAVQELGRSGFTASAYANLALHQLMRTTTLHAAVARQVQGDVLAHVADLDDAFADLFGPFRGTEVANRESAS